jgi:hypothetical protein
MGNGGMTRLCACGQPCVEPTHPKGRWAARCPDCQMKRRKERDAAWREANRAHRIQYMRNYRAANPLRQEAWREARDRGNGVTTLQVLREWRA